MNWDKIRDKALAHTTQALADSVNDDILIIQSISAMEELDKTANMLCRRLREWYEWYSPEFSRKITDNETFAQKILEIPKQEQLKQLGIKKSMGAELSEEDVAEMLTLASTIATLYQQRESHLTYLSKIMKRHCPNFNELVGSSIGARILREAGSLRKLAMIQASTIQLYGAEKALFRHLKTGAKPPKYGYIINHQIVAKAQEKGKAARALADKISIACKVDYFKGEAIASKLIAELEKRFGDHK